MTKQQLAIALADALNILNGLQADLDASQQGPVHDLFAQIPVRVIEESDFRNNGTVTAKQLLK